MEMKKMFTDKIDGIYNIDQYEDPNTAWEVLESLANDRGMDDNMKFAFNRNFYGYIKDYEQKFDTEIMRPVKHGVEYLLSLSLDDREKIYLKGDFWGRTWKLLDPNSQYGIAWKSESGTARFPSQYMHFVKIVFMNDLHKHLSKVVLEKKEA